MLWRISIAEALKACEGPGALMHSHMAASLGVFSLNFFEGSFLQFKVWQPHTIHASTVIPMFLAVPSMILIPASTVVAFRSGIFVSAISCTVACPQSAGLLHAARAHIA